MNRLIFMEKFYCKLLLKFPVFTNGFLSNTAIKKVFIYFCTLHVYACMCTCVPSLLSQEGLVGGDELKIRGGCDIVVSLQNGQVLLRKLPGCLVKVLAHVHTAFLCGVIHLQVLQEPFCHNGEGIIWPALLVKRREEGGGSGRGKEKEEVGGGGGGGRRRRRRWRRWR